MEKGIGVYIITNLMNNKIYIGSCSRNIFIRLKHHENNLRKNKHVNKYLQRAYNKWGKENFIFEIKEFCTFKEECVVREQYYLDTLLQAQEYIRGEKSVFLKKGYNINPTAASPLGRKPSQETKDKISKANKGKISWNKGIPCTEETKQKLREANTGYIFTEEQRENSRKARKHVVMTEETCKKISNWHLGRKKSPEAVIKSANSKKRYILQYDLQGNFIKEWFGVNDTMKALNIFSISQALIGQAKTAGGYIWKYK